MINAVLLCRENASLEQLHDRSVAAGVAVVGVARTLAAAKRLLSQRQANLLVCETECADGAVLPLIRQLSERAESLQPKVLVVTHTTTSIALWDAMLGGASSFWVSTSGRPLAEAVREVMEGGAFMSQPMARQILEHVELQKRMHARGVTYEDMVAPLEITSSERALLLTLAQGLSLEQMAERHCLRPHAVAESLRMVYRKLGWQSRGDSLSLAA